MVSSAHLTSHRFSILHRTAEVLIVPVPHATNLFLFFAERFVVHVTDIHRGHFAAQHYSLHVLLVFCDQHRGHRCLRTFVLTVYLPYECDKFYDDYYFYLSKLQYIIDTVNTPYVFILGHLTPNVLF